ncbi:response regulator [Brevundimonas sp.]|uniref:response regulator n=1 Tax=Brevundimonas sp. TaxID=1871086 RepID=UPI001A32B5B8|nr:response regulator [Brevundimonas sp.]MBJ7484691.1 response regulator [Brevundimonas sp.]
MASGLKPRRSHQVLVVDDDPFIQQLAQAILSPRGHNVVVAGTGAEALARLAQAPPDLVLLDLGLPDVPGLEVLRHLRAARSWDRVRILMLTASHEIGDIVHAKQAGASGYVCKPIQPDTLADMVCDLLEQDSLLWLDDYTRAHKGS